MRPRHAGSLLCAVLAGCGGGDPSGAADAGAGDAAIDAGACSAAAVLGTCTTPEGGECVNPGGDGSFEVLVAGSELSPVVGFQGLPMFVLSTRLGELDVGVEDDYQTWPLVEVSIFHGDSEVANYFGRGRFEAGDSAYEMSGLFLVLYGPAEPLVGEPLRAEITVDDRRGVRSCGELDFVAGPVH